MARAGRPAKPIEQKRALGNPGKRPLPDAANLVILPGAVGVPDPMRPLGPHGFDAWQRIWTAGATWVSPNTDAEFVLTLCEDIDERQELRALVSVSNDPAERRILRELTKSVLHGLGQLGFSPADRSRLGVAEVKAMSKLEQLQAMKRDRANG